MTYMEDRIIEVFTKKYKEVLDSHLIEGHSGILDPTELSAIASGITSVILLKDLIEEGRY